MLFPFIALSYGYAGYWGLAIGRRLIVRDYRTQAFVASAAAFYVVLLLVVAFVIPVSAESGVTVVLLNALVDYGVLIVIIYWVDTTVSIARRSDPFERDTLHYSISKYFWFLAFAAPVIAALLLNPIILVYTTAAPLDAISLSLALTPLFVAGSFGAVLMFLGASRSKDRTLKSHIRWFGRGLAVVVATFAAGGVWRSTGGASSPYLIIVDPIFFGGQFLVAYCFYRSARSLAPTTKNL